MELRVREEDEVVILDLAGELDLYSAGELKQTLTGTMERGRFNVLVNFEKVSYVDSSGIGVLISFLTKLKKEGGACKLVNVRGSVRMVFELTRLHKLFQIFETEEEALASF